MDEIYFQSLLEKYRKNEISAGELSEFTEAIGTGAYDETVKASIQGSLESTAQQWDETRQQVVLKEILRQIEAETPVKRLLPERRKWLSVAAAVLTMLAIGWYTVNRLKTKPVHEDQIAVQDISPGRPGAVLILANGNKVVLDTAGNGTVASQAGVDIVLNNGGLAYAHATSGEVVAEELNTVLTPRGRQFSIVLPDGSKVWINAESSLRFPVRFSGKERQVQLTGEAYFEVAENSSQPFRVLVNDKTQVLVLGTSFNINAYGDQPRVKATLVTGKVNIRNGKAEAILVPGQEASIASDITVADHADINKAIAWKNGAFDFNNVTIEELAAQLERWYDIEVTYDHHISQVPFGGKISRKVSLKTLVRLMDGTGLSFRLAEGRKLIITERK
ncbi:FecR family protein [Chitinophaga sp. RCC_12]|uniref:FecR family protein n=1 Tax=Chitinophaga sp. RCC_12 TaxID=3239226 RepID=UPI003525F0A0